MKLLQVASLFEPQLDFAIRCQVHRQLHIAGVFEVRMAARDVLLQWLLVTRLQHRIAEREIPHAFYRNANSAVIEFEFSRASGHHDSDEQRDHQHKASGERGLE